MTLDVHARTRAHEGFNRSSSAADHLLSQTDWTDEDERARHSCSCASIVRVAKTFSQMG